MARSVGEDEKLIQFLRGTMSMTGVYQPVIMRELIKSGGTQSKDNLAKSLSEYDSSVLQYYKRILMRWPRLTLTKHRIVEYDRKFKLFQLRAYPEAAETREQILHLCDAKITEWMERSRSTSDFAVANSVRYLVLKSALGKCQLCGMPALLRPIDVDHIVPRSKADRTGRVFKDGKWIALNSIENLQALCFECNRSKRDLDDTDFRRRAKLVRDKVPSIIASEGRSPIIASVRGNKLAKKLYEKLVEEHAELIAAPSHSKKVDELGDIVEVAIALAESFGVSQRQFMRRIARKRRLKGGFAKGYVYSGDAV